MKGVHRLVNEFAPERYELRLIPEKQRMTFKGSVIISGQKIGRPSKRITLHQNGLKISSAKITQLHNKKGRLNVEIKRVNLLPKLNELRLHTEETLFPGKYELEIDYTGTINQQMHGMYASSFSLNGKPELIIATQFESHHAREVFPCIDEPQAKAVFSLSIKTASRETVISNTPILEQTKSEEWLTTFEDTPRMSTYLLAFAYGKLKCKETKSSSGINIRSYAVPANYDLLDFSLDVAARAIDFFEKYFDTKYPLPKLDMLALPDFSAGAMENWGLITYRESCMLIDPVSSSVESRQFAALIICHEIAHQWFGNLVTMQWWDDLWLNESFANLMEYRAVDELFPEWNIWEHFVNNEVSGAFRRDVLPNVQPVRLEVNHPDEISTLFDPSIVYAKGSVLLRMLSQMIGEDNFKTGLHRYFKKHQYANTVGADLWSELGDASGKDLNGFMNNWLRTSGFPVISVDYTPGETLAKLSQKRLLAGTQDNRGSTWPVPLFPSVLIEPDIMESKDLMITVKDKSKAFLLNNDCCSYFVTNYVNPAHMQSILTEIESRSLSAVNRMTLLQNNILLERTGTVSTASNLSLLKYYDSETEEPVWSAMTGIIANARRLVFATKAEDTMKQYVSQLVSPLISRLGWDGADGENTQTQRLRELALALGASSGIRHVVDEGLKRFGNFSLPNELKADTRNAVYYIGARYGDRESFQKLLSLYKKLENAEEKEEICSGITSAKDTEQLHELIEFLKSDYIRLQDLTTWFAHLISNPYAKDMAWDWLVENWDWLVARYGEDKSHDRYPRYAAGAFSKQTELEKYRDFFEPKMKDPGLTRTISLGIEEISDRINWRSKNEAEVISWLTSWRDKKH